MIRTSGSVSFSMNDHRTVDLPGFRSHNPMVNSKRCFFLDQGTLDGEGALEGRIWSAHCRREAGRDLA